MISGLLKSYKLRRDRFSMGKLIIIRGPPGIGKTTIANTLIAKLDKAFLLRLDETRIDLFQAYLTCAMKYENVIGEMFFGNSHTTNPSDWLSFFPDEKYEKVSVLLTASLEDCLSGIIKRKHPSHWTLSLDQLSALPDSLIPSYADL